jgi:hypothetical protein
MALTVLQRRICLLLAEQRKRSGESYVAGGAALNELLGGSRRSRDVDLFHDTEEALAVTWARDRETLAGAGLAVSVTREGPKWVQDSAFRFFPLVEHESFGLTLHAFDHATNKVLALAGRRKVRDWIDAIQCHETVQPLGYLAWAASGKDPGLSPSFILEQAARTRYVQDEVDALDFEGARPRAADLSTRWHEALEQARELVRLLPPAEVGRCVLDAGGRLLRANPRELGQALAAGRVAFHGGRIRGAFPELRV